MIATATSGGAHKEVAVFVAGALCEHGTFYLPLINRLGEDVSTVVRPYPIETYRGPRDEYQLADELGAIVDTVTAASAGPVHVVAISGGCTAALLLSVHYPQRLRSLTLIEPAWLGNHAWHQHEPAFLQRMDSVVNLPVEQIPRALDRMASKYAPAAGPRTRDLLSGSRQQIIDVQTCWRAWRRAELDWTALKEVQVPVYLPVGQHSHPRVVMAAAALHAAFPDAEVETLTGCRHFTVMTAGVAQLAAGVTRTWRRSRARTAAAVGPVSGRGVDPSSPPHRGGRPS
ncbi:alpha/beta hydrolase [Longispora sp. NPDC051575]|uniref:alpha/beta fold hydrolase n=1 Tax=Longispora sp. NPDC051575 TaxID=3154943 RepID=UPI00344A5819